MRLIATVFFAFIISAAFAQEGPKMEFKDNNESHSFGKIPQGKPVTYEFEFTNTGDQVLILKEVKASCGCTTPYYPTQPIQPGQTEKIKVVYNASRPGNFHKSVRIVTNMKKKDGTEGKTKVLFIKGEVVSDALDNKKEPASPVRIQNK